MEPILPDFFDWKGACQILDAQRDAALRDAEALRDELASWKATCEELEATLRGRMDEAARVLIHVLRTERDNRTHEAVDLRAQVAALERKLMHCQTAIVGLGCALNPRGDYAGWIGKLADRMGLDAEALADHALLGYDAPPTPAEDSDKLRGVGEGAYSPSLAELEWPTWETMSRCKEAGCEKH